MAPFINQNIFHAKLSGRFTASAPSNLALIKYWGKKGFQLPSNASLSLTLRESVTKMQVEFTYDANGPERHWEFLFQDEPNEKFAKKILGHLELMTVHLPFLAKTSLKINSSNTFPHSAGIASSASASGALALVAVALGNLLSGQKFAVDTNLALSSFLARLGSGSGSRSLFPYSSLWGDLGGTFNADHGVESSDEFAVGTHGQIPFMQDLEDLILIVDKGEKSVSSRDGHGLMEKNPYAGIRYGRANQKLGTLFSALKECQTAEDFHAVGPMIESEALELHALMMTSSPPVILMREKTLAIIHELWNWRKELGAPAYFTLDAGPNIHLLYPKGQAASVQAFLVRLESKGLLPLSVIYDGAGTGPALSPLVLL